MHMSLLSTQAAQMVSDIRRQRSHRISESSTSDTMENTVRYGQNVMCMYTYIYICMYNIHYVYICMYMYMCIYVCV